MDQKIAKDVEEIFKELGVAQDLSQLPICHSGQSYQTYDIPLVNNSVLNLSTQVGSSSMEDTPNPINASMCGLLALHGHDQDPSANYQNVNVKALGHGCDLNESVIISQENYYHPTSSTPGEFTSPLVQTSSENMETGAPSAGWFDGQAHFYHPADNLNSNSHSESSYLQQNLDPNVTTQEHLPQQPSQPTAYFYTSTLKPSLPTSSHSQYYEVCLDMNLQNCPQNAPVATTAQNYSYPEQNQYYATQVIQESALNPENQDYSVMQNDGTVQTTLYEKYLKKSAPDQSQTETKTKELESFHPPHCYQSTVQESDSNTYMSLEAADAKNVPKCAQVSVITQNTKFLKSKPVIKLEQHKVSKTPTLKAKVRTITVLKRMFVCKICKSTVASPSKLLEHLVIEHNIQLSGEISIVDANTSQDEEDEAQLLKLLSDAKNNPPKRTPSTSADELSDSEDADDSISLEISNLLEISKIKWDNLKRVSYHCPKCPRSYVVGFSLMRHMRLSHGFDQESLDFEKGCKKSDVYICPSITRCPKHYVTKREMLEHVRSVHVTKFAKTKRKFDYDFDFQVEESQKTTAQDRALRRQNRNKSTEEPVVKEPESPSESESESEDMGEPIICEKCGKQFYEAGSLRGHMTWHSRPDRKKATRKSRRVPISPRKRVSKKRRISSSDEENDSEVPSPSAHGSGDEEKINKYQTTDVKPLKTTSPVSLVDTGPPEDKTFDQALEELQCQVSQEKILDSIKPGDSNELIEGKAEVKKEANIDNECRLEIKRDQPVEEKQETSEHCPVESIKQEFPKVEETNGTLEHCPVESIKHEIPKVVERQETSEHCPVESISQEMPKIVNEPLPTIKETCNGNFSATEKLTQDSLDAGDNEVKLLCEETNTPTTDSLSCSSSANLANNLECGGEVIKNIKSLSGNSIESASLKIDKSANATVKTEKDSTIKYSEAWLAIEKRKKSILEVVQSPTAQRVREIVNRILPPKKEKADSRKCNTCKKEFSTDYLRNAHMLREHSAKSLFQPKKPSK